MIYDWVDPGVVIANASAAGVSTVCRTTPIFFYSNFVFLFLHWTFRTRTSNNPSGYADGQTSRVAERRTTLTQFVLNINFINIIIIIVYFRRQMPATYKGELTLEKTPSYFVTKSVPSRLHNMSSDIRLIVVVRDPVTRAVSDYAQVLALYLLSPPNGVAKIGPSL